MTILLIPNGTIDNKDFASVLGLPPNHWHDQDFFFAPKKLRIPPVSLWPYNCSVHALTLHVSSAGNSCVSDTLNIRSPGSECPAGVTKLVIETSPAPKLSIIEWSTSIRRKGGVAALPPVRFSLLRGRGAV
eukprot:COSAG02_NODE_1521_length_12162_cov_3.464147_7_plen_131_part_00